MGELHGAAEVADFAGQHDAGALGQLVGDPLLRMEERGGDLAAARAEGDAKQLVLGAAFDPKQRCIGDHVDQRDVLALRWRLGVGAADGGAFDVATGVMAQQGVDRVDAEHVIELSSRLRAHDEVKAIAERHHGYSTPISNASPRCPVRYIASSVPGWRSWTWACSADSTASASIP